MPSMFEIYESHADRYHELVMAEDVENNLGQLLHELADWEGASVLEAGVGTGRVTGLYIDRVRSAVCCDQSEHMLGFAEESLAEHTAKITFQQADNHEMPDFSQQFELFIEGWSFGHSIMGCEGAAEMAAMARTLVDQATKNLVSGAPLIIIETMGTNVDEAGAPHEKLDFFYQTLVNKLGFTQHVIETDYQFETNARAADVMGFFFGEEMQQAVEAGGASRIPEWTGVWIKHV